MTVPPFQPFHILLVEDQLSDVLLLEESLMDLRTPVRLSAVGDGVSALRFLRGEDPFREALRPDLVLLDLLTPRVGGLEVLAEMRTDPALRGLPVLVLSTSDRPQDIGRAYDLGANAYFTKPGTLEGYLAFIRLLESFWMQGARLPTRTPVR